MLRRLLLGLLPMGVVVTKGGPGVGTLQLTLLTLFYFPLPTERVLDGQTSIH